MGEPKDAAALELAKKAIDTDYLGTKFEEAEKKLKQAIALCQPKGACSDKVRAQLHRDLGVVYVGGMSRKDEGKAQFTAALKADPAIALDKDLASEEIEAAFDEAKKAGGGGGAEPAEPAPAEPASAADPAAAPAFSKGDLVHTPLKEQAILTPVPIYAELPQGVTATRVQLSYRPFGATAWKVLAMTKVREGYGAEIPCLDVGSATGNLAYFIQAFDADNNPVSYSGTRADPHKIPIRTALEGEPPHLPGQPPPAKCSDPGDCPPEFPGCKGNSSDGDPSAAPEPAPDPASDTKKNWVSLSLQQDFLFLSSTTNTCSGGNDYTCFRDTGEYYDVLPYDKSGGELSGGVGLATTRIMVGYDRALWNFALGVRVGFAFGGGPQAPGGKSFFPVHAEARAAYFFGSDPFRRVGPRPYAVLSGGIAQIDSSVGVIIYENESDFVADKRLTLDAWRKAGTGFASAGLGILYGITPRMGPEAEFKVIQLFGASGTAMALKIGYAVGF